ncbi:YdeI/OmpD-associated family protein [Algoriphagus sp. AGSA1]|uniref:YdeI/OmpD-associated family protein n=1 Tax=Algoriphagus sp. AGSA1 TaxID=2907213 RepID=UPI001F330986|nr:YdeI/OmpD-associated family protein [Algoriphagus sp. AGSA1]MCE7057317.1 YdeI/OmpD-associated family protein [Algoriphagus sp. AGSA1]
MNCPTHTFEARLDIIGINPFVFVPDEILQDIFMQAGRDKSPIPVCSSINGRPYLQTLMKYQGHWRLYVNLVMLENSPKRIGETIEVSIRFDPEKREVPMHPKLKRALDENPAAKLAFDQLIPSKRMEILKYMSYLKTNASIERNVVKVIANLSEK